MAGLSVLSHMHTPPARNSHALSPWGGISTVCSFLTVGSHTRTGLPGFHSRRDPTPHYIAVVHGLPIRILSGCCSPTCPGRAVHPHAGSIILTHRYSFVLGGSHSELGIVCFSSMVFPVKGHSGGPSCVCFPYHFVACTYVCLCPSVKLVLLPSSDCVSSLATPLSKWGH